MGNCVEINGKVIEYEIDKAKRRNIYICIKNGKVIIKGPKKMEDSKAKEIVIKKANWIFKKLQEEKKSTRAQKEEQYLSNEKIYKKEAERKIPEIMEKMILLTGLKPAEYKLSNFKRAWGNCSNKKVIKINRKLVMYSDFAIAYVCLHELCHLKYMNHSKKFWELVESFMPNYIEAEKELK